LTATPGNAQITLSWGSPNNDGGAAIDYYVVYQNGIDIYHPTTTSQNVTGLADGYSYNFTVAAHNSVGTGARTSAVNAMPGSGLVTPGVPTDLVAAAGDGKVTLSWKDPSDSSIIDYYIVFQNGVDVTHTSATSITISGLTNGDKYSFSVAAHSLGGVGTISSVQTTSPVASSSSGAAISSGTMDMILYSGVLATLAIVVAAILFAVKRRGNKT
jgi:hypothetical protein